MTEALHNSIARANSTDLKDIEAALKQLREEGAPDSAVVFVLANGYADVTFKASWYINEQGG